jgi:hypothetical protein
MHFIDKQVIELRKISDYYNKICIDVSNLKQTHWPVDAGVRKQETIPKLKP